MIQNREGEKVSAFLHDSRTKARTIWKLRISSLEAVWEMQEEKPDAGHPRENQLVNAVTPT